MLKNLHFETQKKSCVKKEVGTEILKIDISYQNFTLNDDNKEKVVSINRFYESIVKNAQIYAEGKLFDKIRLEYENDTDVKKRFRFKKYTYRVECYISDLTEEYLCMCVDSSLIRNGQKEGFGRMSQVWDASLRNLVPIKHKSGISVTKADGYYIKGGNYVIYSHDGGYHEEIISKMP